MRGKRFLAVAAAGLAAFAADSASLGGKWQIHINAGGNERDQSCTFTQKDQELTGTCTTDRGVVEISGKVDGKKVTWTYKSDYNGSPLTVVFNGALDSPDKISGGVTAVEFSVEGEFTATHSK